MNRIVIKHLLLSILLAGILNAGDLRVNIINGTNNTKGNADRVALMDLSSGMAETAAAANVTGSTTFSDVTSEGQSQYLIRATLNGITYSEMFVPTAGVSAWETSVTVYDTEPEATSVKAVDSYFVIYAFETQLYIRKLLDLENVSNPPVSYFKSPGVVKVFLPENVTEVENVSFKNGTMPLNSQPIQTEDGQVLPYALKPGTSQIDMSYYLPYDNSAGEVIEKIGYDVDHYHVYTMPMDLNISGSGLSREGTDNENGLAIYSINGVKAGTTLQFKVSGQGISETAPEEHANHQQNTGRIVVESRMDLSTELAISGVLILAALIALFMSVTQQNEDMKQESILMLKEQKIALLKQYASTDKDSSERDKVLYRLVSVYKTLDRIK